MLKGIVYLLWYSTPSLRTLEFGVNMAEKVALEIYFTDTSLKTSELGRGEYIIYGNIHITFSEGKYPYAGSHFFSWVCQC